MWVHEKLFEKFHTGRETGLTTAKAEELLKTFGENNLSEKKGLPWYVLLIKEFTTFFCLLLWIGGFLCFIAYGLDNSSMDNLFLGIVLCLVVIINGTFSF